MDDVIGLHKWMRCAGALSIAAAAACSASDAAPSAPGADASDVESGDASTLGDGAANDASAQDATPPDAAVPMVIDCPASAADAASAAGPTRVRVMAANTTSGTQQAYEDPGIHIFRGVAPDIALVQEFNYRLGTIRDLVNAAFGPDFCFARENRTGGIPNGIVSRYPIVEAGAWVDPNVPDRAFAYARIDVPGPIDLWAISVHLKTSTAATRDDEAKRIALAVQSSVPSGDYVVLGGDFNTDARTETAIADLAAAFVTAGPYPVDQNGNEDTNASRAKPYDWVLANPALDAKKTTLTIGASTYANGLVFDSRVYTPLSEVAPAVATDSAAAGMQHMAVSRDFVLGGP